MTLCEQASGTDIPHKVNKVQYTYIVGLDTYALLLQLTWWLCNAQSLINSILVSHNNLYAETTTHAKPFSLHRV